MPQEIFDIPCGEIVLYTGLDLGIDGKALFDLLISQTPWEQRSVEVYGKTFPQPRLICWYGNNSYTYSGLRLKSKPLPKILLEIKARIEHLTHSHYNGVLLNYYKDGSHAIGMHSDDEIEFGDNPTIASLSLGEERTIIFQRKNTIKDQIKITLPHESVLVMSGPTQRYWKHGIAKTKKVIGPRINLTFRNIINPRE